MSLKGPIVNMPLMSAAVTVKDNASADELVKTPAVNGYPHAGV